ncbi:restriction endonuclease [Paraburkholderia tropica]|uniref:restriction endonuclease n=1 Tax=Paraburkholderia tropica TaxID=92647 RepID=UPI002ABE7DC5|nr:restriction endonuclease [Paraburkholderia tropica]
MFKESIEYELLTQSIYQEILARESADTVDVKHNVSLAGRSGVEHQIDVFWEFRQAGVKHRVLIECKNYGTSLTLEKARNFFAVLHDIGNCQGIMVTKTGYQSGVVDFCRFYGIELKLLRAPVDSDWVGRIKTVKINVTPRVPVSTIEHPITCALFLQPTSDAQDARLRAAVHRDPNLTRASSSTKFLGKDGEPKTEEMAFWLPRQLNVLQYEDGGPYEKNVELNDHYLSVDIGSGHELVKVIGVKIGFWVETLESQEIVINAVETVNAILKDYQTGDIEYAHRKQI